MMSSVIVTPPVLEPVTTAEVGSQLAIGGTDHTARVQRLISLAREYVENYTGRALITQTWDYFADSFPKKIVLPKSPLQSVTTLKYTDTDGTQQTLDPSMYTVNTNADSGYIIPAYNEDWPDTRDVPDALEIRIVCGYGLTSTTVPDVYRHAMLLLIGNWFENTEETQPFSNNRIAFGVNALLDQHRVWRV